MANEMRGMNFKDRPYQCGTIAMGWEKIKGWLTLNEAQVLYDCAKLAPANGQAVELGSYYGRSANVISQVRPLFCIDDWREGVKLTDGTPTTDGDFMPGFIRNVEGLPVLPIRGKTVEVAQTFAQPIAFLFVDASHDYESCKADMEAWFPKLIPGAIVVFHDYAPGWPGVMKAVGEISKDFKPLMKSDSCIAFKYIPPRVEAKSDKKLAVLMSLSSAYSYMILNAFFFSFIDLIEKMRPDLKRHGFKTWKPFHSAQMPLDANRNQLVKDALDWGADAILFLDADQTFPGDMIGKMLDRLDKDSMIGAVSGLAFKKGPPFPPIDGVFTDGEDPQIIVPIDPELSGPTSEVDVIGMGCVMVPRSVFELIPYPWFQYTVYDKNGEVGITEDIHFCNRLKDIGLKIIVDNTIDSGHIIQSIVSRETWRNWRSRVVKKEA